MQVRNITVTDPTAQCLQITGQENKKRTISSQRESLTVINDFMTIHKNVTVGNSRRKYFAGMRILGPP